MIFKHYGIDIFYPITNGDTLKSIDNVDYWVRTLHELELRARSNAKIAVNRKNREAYAKDTLKFQYLITQLEDEEAKFIIELPSKKEILKDKQVNGKFENGLKAEFKPLTISDYSNQLLHFGDIRLFMTGTLGNKDKFCQWIGIDPKETYYIFVKSPFPKTNRPIIKSYIGSMSGRKGRNPNWRPTREDTIKRFESSHKPIILVGAGLKDGVDFKGDKCRYQIMFKMPYPSLAGKQVNIRMHYDKSWYAYQTIMPLMQAYGRGIRDNEDHCVMYVLDSDFDKLLQQHKYLFNEYFLEAIQKNVESRPLRKPVQINGGK